MSDATSPQTSAVQISKEHGAAKWHRVLARLGQNPISRGVINPTRSACIRESWKRGRRADLESERAQADWHTGVISLNLEGMRRNVLGRRERTRRLLEDANRSEHANMLHCILHCLVRLCLVSMYILSS